MFIAWEFTLMYGNAAWLCPSDFAAYGIKVSYGAEQLTHNRPTLDAESIGRTNATSVDKRIPT